MLTQTHQHMRFLLPAVFRPLVHIKLMSCVFFQPQPLCNHFEAGTPSQAGKGKFLLWERQRQLSELPAGKRH